MKEYALYKGEEFVLAGTKENIKKKLNISERTFMFYKSKVYKKRLEERNAKNARIIIELPSDEEYRIQELKEDAEILLNNLDKKDKRIMKDLLEYINDLERRKK